MPRNRRTPVSVVITEQPMITVTPEVKDNSLDFLGIIRTLLMKEHENHPHTHHVEVSFPITATTAHGLEIDSLLFRHTTNHGAKAWGAYCDSAHIWVWDDSIESVWKTVFEFILTKAQCKDCNTVFQVGEPCIPCSIRKLTSIKECVVCKENKHNFYQLRCSHAFCKDCIKRVNKRKCPLCRAPFNINHGLVERGPSDDDDDDDDAIIYQ
jgi:hypothetical protein